MSMYTYIARRQLSSVVEPSELVGNGALTMYSRYCIVSGAGSWAWLSYDRVKERVCCPGSSRRRAERRGGGGGEDEERRRRPLHNMTRDGRPLLFVCLAVRGAMWKHL